MNAGKRYITMMVVLWVYMMMQIAYASNLVVTNVSIVGGGAGYSKISTRVSWDNSWRANWEEPASNYNTNWDAAWLFVKYRVATNGAVWCHASLSTNASDHTAPAGAVIKVGVSTNSGGNAFGCGAFLYRSADGNGSWTNTIKLRWNYAQDGVSSTANVDVSVHAIEMVYVPQGSFKVGSSGVEIGRFAAGPWASGATTPFTITNEAALLITNDVGGLWGTSASGYNSIGSPGVLAAAYPKGYNAFYCMKYEISQGQWVSFFNMLTTSQNQRKSNDLNVGRDITGTPGKGTQLETYRNTVAWAGGVADATCTSPDRACNFLSWADGAAYADWAGLRPMTELEFEKACRGPLTPVANEYAWGSTVVNAVTGFAGGADGSGTETALPANANSCLNNIATVPGPVRCGIFATPVSARADAGATYWGIMEMSGNLWERVVTVADAGRTFTGTVGDGKLDDTTGNANADYWPGTSASGSGYRGGGWNSSPGDLHASDRIYAAHGSANRQFNFGFRAVRPVSSVVP